MKATCKWNVALMVSASLVAWTASPFGPARMHGAPIDPVTWKTHLQTTSFFEGDGFGTSVDDVYIDADLPTTNFNGAGLDTRFATGGGDGARPAYIRFNNSIFSQIPAGSMIYKATLELTASAPSTGAGFVKVATGAANWTEASTFNTATGRDSVAGGGGFDQLYSRNFGTSLVNGSKVTIDIAPAVRAWFDNSQNPAHGFLNRGLSLNINPQGAGSAASSALFFDSETATAGNRPKLTVEYLDPSSGYKGVLYTNTTTNTAQVQSIGIQDTVMMFQDANFTSRADDNFGGSVGIYSMRALTLPNNLATENPGVLLRYTGLTPPNAGPGFDVDLADAELSFGGSDGWNVNTTGNNTFNVHEVLKNWIEGAGTGTAVAGATFNSFDRSAGNPLQNPWQTPGAQGATDANTLGLNFTNISYQGGAQGGSIPFAQLLDAWLAGGTNNGILVRYDTGGDDNFAFIIGTRAGNHQDPYLSPSILAVFQITPPVPEPSTLALLGMGMIGMAVKVRRRRLAA